MGKIVTQRVQEAYQSGSRLLVKGFDMFFAPLPQLLLFIRVDSLSMWKRDTCPGSEILKNVPSTLADTLRQCEWQKTYLAIELARRRGSAGVQRSDRTLARGINFRQGWSRSRREIVRSTGTGTLCEIRYGASFLLEEFHVSAGDDVEECIFEEAPDAVYECTCRTRDICSRMEGDGHDAFVPVSSSKFIRE